jgi:hypothetical protein
MSNINLNTRHIQQLVTFHCMTLQPVEIQSGQHDHGRGQASAMHHGYKTMGHGTIDVP